ncbi:MAG: maleylpyruvate isomerase family mycothiol-dependent enzyme [Actinomycetota bacterium]|nr:maleylpyruvate isomerase family mycothiol-dependent enzyme [Actinomycetota bacterium]
MPIAWPMLIAQHIDSIEANGRQLADAARNAGWDAPIPGLDWDVRALVTHVGGVHRWAADTVTTASRGTAATAPRANDLDAAARVGSGPGDDELLDWFAQGLETLVQALRAAPADIECFTFLPAPSPLAFWARRQAHETAVHRADAEAATGTTPEFSPAFAQDGIDEMLTGFARRRNPRSTTPATFVLAPDDGGARWLVSLGDERIVGTQLDDDSSGAAGEPQVRVCGSSSALYLWLWNRSSAVAFRGDRAAADLWSSVQRVRWS